MSQCTTLPVVLYAIANTAISADEAVSAKQLKVYHSVSRVVFHVSLTRRPQPNREDDPHAHSILKTNVLGPYQNICAVPQNGHWTTCEFHFKSPISINGSYLFKLVDNANASVSLPTQSSLAVNIVCYE